MPSHPADVTTELWSLVRSVAEDLERCTRRLADPAQGWTETDAEQVDGLVMVLDDLGNRVEAPDRLDGDDGGLAALYESPLATNALADAIAELAGRAGRAQHQAWERAGRPVPMFTTPAPVLADPVLVTPFDLGRVEVPLDGSSAEAAEAGDPADPAGEAAVAAPEPEVHPRRTDRIAVVVEALTVLGVMVLVFVVYAVWGSALPAAREQRLLEREFDATLRASVALGADEEQDSGILGGPTVGDEEGDDDGAAAADEEQPDDVGLRPTPLGSPIAMLDLPTIGSRHVVVEGTRAEELMTGPGHLRSTPQPGRAGNSVVFGRRTTFGGPFADLDELRPGDPMDVVTTDGKVRYVVQEVRQVKAGDPDPVGTTFSNRLTLVTSNEEFTTSGRLVAIGLLEGNPVPTPTDDDGQVLPPPIVDNDELGTQRTGVDWAWAVLWTQAIVVVYFGAKWLYRHWLPWSTWLVSAPVFVLVALVWLDSLARLFPSTL